MTVKSYSKEDFITIVKSFSDSVKLQDLGYKIDKIEKYKIIENRLIGCKYSLVSGNKKYTVSINYGGEFTVDCGDKLDNQCNFKFKPKSKIIRRKTLENIKFGYCKHIAALFAEEAENIINIVVPEIISDLNNANRKEVNNQNDELDYIKKYLFKIPVLIEGDRGSGKTYDVFKLAKELDIEPVVVGGHSGIESIDLLGSLIPFSIPVYQNETLSKVRASDLLDGADVPYQLNIGTSQQLIWKDGPVTEAFRQAANGNKSILIIDELLRIPQRELNILLTALTPINNQYVLRTGRVLFIENGIAKEEVIKAPIENIFIVATTNIGGSYAIDDIDPALAERFIVKRKDTKSSQLLSILKAHAEAKGFDCVTSPSLLPTRLKEFYEFMVEAKKQGFVENIPTTRTLSRAIQLADNENDVWNILDDQILLWIGRDLDGFPIEEQYEKVKLIINKVSNDDYIPF